jgi:hypothetical protein
MFGAHFYHATTRKSVAVFGTLFNNISVIRKDGSGGVLNQIKVPLSYGPKQKFLARIDQETMEDASMALKLPRMGFEITSLAVDLNKKENKLNKITSAHATDKYKKQHIHAQTPYNIGMQLSILTKNQDDGLQILEQILPYFQPDYSVTIKPIDGWADYKQDVPIILNSVSIEDSYDGDFTTRRVLTYTLDFTMKMTYYSGIGAQGIIKTVEIDWFNKTNTAEKYEGTNIKVNPLTAEVSDTLVTGTPGTDEYTIVTTYDPLGVPDSFSSVVGTVSGTFTQQEVITGSLSGNTAEMSIFTAGVPEGSNTMGLAIPSGWFQVGETLTGSSSGATAVIESYT